MPSVPLAGLATFVVSRSGILVKYSKLWIGERIGITVEMKTTHDQYRE